MNIKMVDREEPPRGRRRKGGKGGKGRRKNKEFMDAALDAFIRDQALRKWREVDGLMQGAGIDLTEALGSSGEFYDKGPYRNIWRDCWQRDFESGARVSAEAPMGPIEATIREAVLAERAERQKLGDVLLEDTFSYKEFITRAMEKLLEESSGEIEEWD